jgi:hypothetical protein
MITGSNTNVRHRGKLFHIQTEDSGRRNPHVISHLYHGGTILASQKTRYSELLDLESENLDKDVRLLIEEQHKLMLERLKTGVYDAVIDERLGTGTGSEPAGDLGSDTAGGTEPVSPPPAPEEAPPAAAEATAPRGFGDGIVSQKPLDGLILEYLVEKAHDRAAGREAKPAKRSSDKG